MIILDTNALIWWSTAPENLSKKAHNIIEKEIKETGILVSSMSIWEVYLLVESNRVGLLIDVDTWLERIESLPFVTFISVDNKIAAKSVKLPDLSTKDPADRIIIATAREYGATLVTSDKRILLYPHVESFW